MTKHKRQPMATKLPGYRVQLHHILIATFLSFMMGWSITFFVMNPDEICYMTDLGSHDMLGNK